MENSSRHHYIPEYFIKGFVNDDGLLYVYDKQKDEILKKRKSPKQIMFEWDRNTLSIDRVDSSIIEDVWFKEIDSESSAIIETFRDSKNLESLHSIDNMAKMQLFIINQLWRLPKFDFAFDYLFNNASILDTKGKEMLFKNLEEKEVFKSLERIFLPTRIIKEIKRLTPNERIMSKLFGRGKGEFILGDYPMLFKNQPTSIDEILYEELFLPISSDRLYAVSSNDDFNFKFEDSIKINTLIINQSYQYVCSHSREFLEKSVTFYKKVGKIISIESLKGEIFR